MEPPKGIYTDYLIDKFNLDSILRSKGNGERLLQDLRHATSELFNLFDLKLRQQEQFFSQLAIIIKIFPNVTDYHFTYLCFLLLISNYYRDKFSAFCKQEIGGEKLLELLENLEHKNEFYKSYDSIILEVFLFQLFKDKNLREQRLTEYEASVGTKEDISERSERLIKKYEQLRYMTAKEFLDNILIWITYSEQFSR